MKKFIAYLEAKNFTKRTQDGCLQGIKQFFDFTKKEDLQITKPDVLKYLEHLKNKGLQNITRKRHLTYINHYFAYLYENEKITENPCWFLKIRGTNKRTLYKIYTPEELDTLLDNYYQLFVRNYNDSNQRHDFSKKRSALNRERNAVMLSILVNQGIVTTELCKIELDDLDLIKATLKIRGGKMLNNRTLPLKATQIGLIMNYLLNIRPQFLEYQTTENNKLFLPLPEKSRKKTSFNKISKDLFLPLSKQVKTIDKQFFNFLQVRASIITFWIKTQGLRKAQYLAGHRNISTTEAYLPNNLDGLIDDINKLHPL
jgi:site-specific recombinase XerD